MTITKEQAYNYTSTIGLTAHIDIMTVTSANLAITRAGVETEEKEISYHICDARPFSPLLHLFQVLDKYINNQILVCIEELKQLGKEARYYSSILNTQTIEIFSRCNAKFIKEIQNKYTGLKISKR